MSCSLEELLAYVGTWTASRSLTGIDGSGWIEEAREKLAASWGAQEKRIVSMPLHIRCGRLD